MEEGPDSGKGLATRKFCLISITNLLGINIGSTIGAGIHQLRRMLRSHSTSGSVRLQIDLGGHRAIAAEVLDHFRDQHRHL
jgi:hypothetical protein